MHSTVAAPDCQRCQLMRESDNLFVLLAIDALNKISFSMIFSYAGHLNSLSCFNDIQINIEYSSYLKERM